MRPQQTRCWKCDGKGYSYWDVIDRIFNDRSKCLECDGLGYRIRYVLTEDEQKALADYEYECL